MSVDLFVQLQIQVCMKIECLFEDVQRRPFHFLKLFMKRWLLMCSYGSGILPGPLC